MSADHLYLLAVLKSVGTLTIGYNSVVSLAIFADLLAANLVCEVERNQYGIVYAAAAAA